MKHTGLVILAVLGVASFLLGQSPAVESIGMPLELTSADDYFIGPKWSPDGTAIAVSREKYTGIYLITFPGGEIVTLSEDVAAGFGMEWSHGGDKIAARIARFEKKRRYNAVAVFDAISGSRSMITDYTSLLPGTPKWTKDDQFIYLDGSDRFRLYSVSGEGSAGESVSLPDERTLFVKKDKITVRDISSESEQVVDVPPGRILNLTISPDGRKMAFEIMGGHLWAADVNGGNAIDLGRGYAPAWSPDSDKIVYMITTDDGHRYLSSDIFVIMADGTGQVNITNSPDVLEMHPSWSPDGEWIAYDTLDKGQILVQNVR